jgi:uncharacterized OB-fold protein
MSEDSSSPTPGHSIESYRTGYEEEHRLRGFRSGCGFVSATWGLRCPRCGDLWQETELPKGGHVVAFTVQTVPSDEFLNDAPYAYVVVELEGGARVTGWMPDVRAESDLTLGDEVRYRESYRAGLCFERVAPSAGPRS